MTDQRIKGQEVSVKVIEDGVLLTSIDSISTFNDAVSLELKESGYLGEFVNRFDEILNGFGGDFEFNVTTSAWNLLVESIIARAKRERPNVVFNVVRVDLYPNGESAIYTYRNVFWGEIPTNVAGRGEYVKPRMQFKCSERPTKINQVL